MSNSEDADKYHPLVAVAEDWPVAEQIELAKEFDERALTARELQHPAYSSLRRMGFEARQMARRSLRTGTEDDPEVRTDGGTDAGGREQFLENEWWELSATQYAVDGPIQPYIKIPCPNCETPNVYGYGFSKSDIPLDCIECDAHIFVRVSISCDSRSLHTDSDQ